jgi:8-oxo-dGTP diphosphatase
MPNNKPGSRLIKAAGGVAWRPGPDGEPEILLVHRKKYDDWSLPKGKTEPGEQLPVTAVREVLEEGGARLALGRRLLSVRYNVGGRPKRVHYWAASVLSVDEHGVPNSEVDEVTWLPAARAVDKVSYAHDHGVLADFAARPARTVPLILLRHSKAVAKHGWKRTDAARPLDDSGRSDAKALADLLACFAPNPRLISSTAVRCADTLRPLAQLTGEQVRLEKSLYVHNHSPRMGAADSASEIAALVREVIASGEPTVICAHRENLPVLQKAALAALAAHPDDAAGASAPGDPRAGLPAEWDETLPTSGFWVVNIAPSAPAPALDPSPAPAPALALAPALDPSPAPAPAAPRWRRRWWQFRRTRPARPTSSSSATTTSATTTSATTTSATTASATTASAATTSATTTSATTASAATTPDSATPSATTAGRVGVLVSADRYDLTEP